MGAAIDEREWWGVPVSKHKALVTFVRMAALVLTEASPVQPAHRCVPLLRILGTHRGTMGTHRGTLGTHTKAYRYCGLYSRAPSQIDALRLDLARSALGRPGCLCARLSVGPLLAHSLFVLMGGMGWSLWQTAAAQTCELPALLRHIEAEVNSHC